MKKVLVVCTGNICRSPLAQVWLQAKWGGLVSVESAGTAALAGHKADPLAIEVADEHGLDLNSHVGRQVDLDMLLSADLVLVMEAAHREYLIKMAPWATGKIWCFGQKGSGDIPDPYRLGRNAFVQTFQIIQRQGETWLAFLKAI